MHPLDDRFGAGDDLLGRGFTSNVIRPHEQNDIGDAGVGEYVSLKPFHASGAVGGRLQVLADYRIPADALIDHGSPHGRIGPPVQPHRHPIFPTVVRVARRARAVGDRVAKRHNAAAD